MMYSIWPILFAVSLPTPFVLSSVDIDRKYVKCLVCKIVVEELTNEVNSVSSSLKYTRSDILDQGAKPKQADVEMRRSDLFLVELMERLCKKMNDYARAHHKTTGDLKVIPLLINGEMNPDMLEYEFVTDGDLESLEYYCDSILSEYDEDIIRSFKGGSTNVESELCFDTEICKAEENNRKSSDEL